MPKYTVPPTFRMAITCTGCARAMLRGLNETLQHFLARPRCPRCRGAKAKTCQWCGCDYKRPLSIGLRQWRSRRYCDRFCAARATAPARSETLHARHQSQHLDTLSGPPA